MNAQNATVPLSLVVICMGYLMGRSVTTLGKPERRKTFLCANIRIQPSAHFCCE